MTAAARATDTLRRLGSGGARTLSRRGFAGASRPGPPRRALAIAAPSPHAARGFATSAGSGSGGSGNGADECDAGSGAHGGAGAALAAEDSSDHLRAVLENIRLQMAKRSMKDKSPKIALAFTCTHTGDCSQATPEDRRAVKIISKKSYEEGVVLVKCPCEKLHLIADNLGWFGEERNIEEILRNKGEEVQRLRAEDLVDLDAQRSPSSGVLA